MKTYINEEIRILVVDDVLKNIQVIGKILRDNGFPVSVAKSGAQALEIAKTTLPDLILLDILMPEMDGFETCRRLKKETAFKSIPIIFLSALSETKDKVKGFEAGAVDFVIKPIQPEELLPRIHLHLTLKFLQDDLEAQVKLRTLELLSINQTLIKQQEEYRSVMVAVPDPIIVYDLSGRTVYINPAFTRVFGWSSHDLIGKRPDFVVEGEEQKTDDAIKKTFELGYITDFETRRYTRDGKILDVSISGASYQNAQGEDMGMVVNLRDITLLKKTAEAMIQNEKMMSLGGLAAGMAHEIRNPLAAIIQNTQVLGNRLFGRLPANDKVAEECGVSLEAIQVYLETRKVRSILESLRESGIRVNTIIDNMLSFSRKSEARLVPCNLAGLMDKTIELASQDYDLKKKYNFRQIRIERKYDPDLPEVPCEASKIQQVFFNILKNGSEAMVEAGQPDPCFILRTRQKRDMACVEIEDNGPGIDADIRKKIFVPFFTTKGSDVGTGLGLSISYFIVTKGHQGTLEVESIPGKGTNFILCLPLKPMG
ncbi:MAG: response regulator [Pseudomonadota bacterium]